MSYQLTCWYSKQEKNLKTTGLGDIGWALAVN